MIKSVIINGIEYNIDDGVALSDKATEELDTITFSISNVEEIELEPFQEVEVHFNNGNIKYFIVNTWIDNVATFYGLKNYTINCISQTKKLERVVLPNMTITQPLGLADSEKRKYLKYVNQIMSNYIKKVYPELSSSNAFTELIRNEIAVEEQFNTPTAKEYINAVLSKIGKIVKVENNRLNYLNIAEKNKAIDISKILFSNKSQTIEDYHSSIITDLQGVQSSDPTIIKEFVGVRAPDNAVLTYDNAVVPLAHNIDKIHEVILYVPMVNRTSSSGGGMTETNVIARYIMYSEEQGKPKNVVEKQIYDTLKISNDINVNGSDYKRMNIYYKRGSNLIEGLGYTEKLWFAGLGSIDPAIENFIYWNHPIENYNVVFPDKHDLRDINFEVTYSAIDDVATKINKNKNYKSEVRDNQSNSYVDLDKFAKSEQEKLNRLGNELLEINARYYDIDEVPELLDYIDDYILAEREIVYHRDYIDFKGKLYKDFVKKNFYYGVNAKKRSTQLISGSEAVTRKEINKETYTFDFEDKDDDKALQRYILGKLQSNNYKDISEEQKYKPIQIVTCSSIFLYGEQIDYKLEPDVRLGNNNIFINLKWYDNINVGMKLDGLKDKTFNEALTGGKGSYGQQYVSYTDENGEVWKINIKMYDKYDYDKTNYSTYDETNLYPEYNASRINDNFCILERMLTRNKDNREILNETFQIELKSTKDIYVNNRLIKKTPFVNWNLDNNQLYVYISEQQTYNVYNCDKVVSSAKKMSESQMYIDYSDFVNFNTNNILNNRIMLYNNNVDLTKVKSWALADENGNVYLAVNKRPTDDVIRTIIYLNKEE